MTKATIACFIEGNQTNRKFLQLLHPQKERTLKPRIKGMKNSGNHIDKGKLK
jgi:hypothetical protein